MVKQRYIQSTLFMLFLSFYTWGQDVALNTSDADFTEAYNLAYEGKHNEAQSIALEVLKKNPQNSKVRTLVARTYSWSSNYEKARVEFNRVLSQDKNNRAVWVLAVKNELYAQNNITALGLANKALGRLKNDSDLERLKKIALTRINSHTYTEKSWIDTLNNLTALENNSVTNKTEEESLEKVSSKIAVVDKTIIEKKEEKKKDVLKNRIAIRNSFTVYDERYTPVVSSTIEFKRQTLAGSLLPRINYSNRNGVAGIQYDIDFYPKFSKRFYAYLNYGYSNASIYPNHKLGGDLYANLPHAIELSLGGRYISLDTRDVTTITNSIGHYRGNYYFSLRTSLVPKEDDLIQYSGNLLIRKYLKDANNYLSFNAGMGYSPEIKQLIFADQLLAETLLYIESQRISIQYQFTGKRNSNTYSTSLGVSRQELSFESGSFIWAVSAGFAYQVQF